MAVTKETVQCLLSSIGHPASGEDLMAAGIVRALMVDSGKVQLVLDIAADDVEAMQETRAEVEARILSLEGVESATVVLTAARDAPPPNPDSGTSETECQPVKGVKHVIVVGSGKGGVGKSTVSSNLALALADLGLRIGLLDADIYGPSLPRMMGATGHPIGRGNTLIPLAAQGIKLMSVGNLMAQDKALVWRGPILGNAITQMLHDVAWAPLDILVIDLPPGTGDVQIALTQKTPIDGAIIVTTPQDIALLDARRALDMFRQTGTPVLGLVENMSTHICSHCGHEDPVFGHGGGAAEAERQAIPFLGALPLTRTLRETSDKGTPIIHAHPDSAEAERIREIAERINRLLGRPERCIR